MGEAPIRVARWSFYGRYSFPIASETELGTGEGPHAVFLPGTDVDWCYVVSSPLVDRTSVPSTAGSAWSKNSDIGRVGCTLEVERWVERSRVEELDPLGRG